MSADVNKSTQPFQPIPLSTVSVVLAATGSVRTALTLPGANSDGTKGPPCGQFKCFNSGTVPAFIEFGNSSVVANIPAGATPGSKSIAPGATETITVAGNPFPTNVAVNIVSGATTVYVTPGDGI